ncbi:hypothetical protein C8R44DRAFT_892555 [Mycena epipterygia]|nr:hypothetical protein C8R44DRAFT_892555 [Mycena epipterygia]
MHFPPQTPDAGFHVCDESDEAHAEPSERLVRASGEEHERSFARGDDQPRNAARIRDVAQAGFVIHVNFTRKNFTRVAAAANSSSGHHHHLPTLHGLGHSTVQHSPSSDTTSSHSQDTANNQHADASTPHVDWTPDAGRWPAAFHAAFYAQVWCTYRTGLEPIRGIPGLSALPGVGRRGCDDPGGGIGWAGTRGRGREQWARTAARDEPQPIAEQFVS